MGNSMLTIGQFAIFAAIMITMYPLLKVGGWADKTIGTDWPLCLIVIVAAVGLVIAFFYERRQQE